MTPPSPFPSCFATEWMEKQLLCSKMEQLLRCCWNSQMDSLLPSPVIHGVKRFPGNPKVSRARGGAGLGARAHTPCRTWQAGKAAPGTAQGWHFRSRVGTAEAPRDPIHGTRNFWIRWNSSPPERGHFPFSIFHRVAEHPSPSPHHFCPERGGFSCFEAFHAQMFRADGAFAAAQQGKALRRVVLGSRAEQGAWIRLFRVGQAKKSPCC